MACCLQVSGVFVLGIEVVILIDEYVFGSGVTYVSGFRNLGKLPDWNTLVDTLVADFKGFRVQGPGSMNQGHGPAIGGR